MESEKALVRRNSFLLVLTAMIWGVAFVAQSKAGDACGPFTFCFLRFLLGGIVLIPVIALLDKLGLSGNKPETKEDKRLLIKGGLSCGAFICLTTIFQQTGIYLGTSAGKAGFLTACYIVLVPIIGIFFKRKCGINVWIAVVITVAGLYLLCMKGDFSVQFSDGLVLLCALACSMHILVIDRFVSKNVDPVRLSCIQFFTASALSAIPMLVAEMKGGVAEWAQIFTMKELWLPLLYTGIMSSGVAYTLQVVGQKGVNPAVASLLMSLESVFAVLAGWLLLHERMTARELIGCLLIFIAVVLAQIPKKAADKYQKE